MTTQLEGLNDLEGLLRVDQVAKALDVSEGTAYRWIRAGLLPAIKAGGSIRVDADALRRFLRMPEGGVDVIVHSRQPAPDATSLPSPPTGALGMILVDLEAQAVELKAQSRVLEKIAAALGITVEI
jgi:excisionase family DNA binding protein